MNNFAYVGCRTTIERNAKGKGIKVYKIENGKWNEIQLVENLKNPSYMCLDNYKQYLYVVHGDTNSASAYKINNNGKLSFINKITSIGKNPVFISVDKNNKYVYISTLQGGEVTVHRILENGGLSEQIFTERLPGKTDDKTSYAHQCIFDNNKEYIFVPAQGRGQGFPEINVFKVKDNGSLLKTFNFQARKYDEPRHVAIHPNNRYLYNINEWNNSITYFLFDEKEGTLNPQQIVSSIPDTYTGESQASAILIHPNGKYIFASNRIMDTITTLSIDENTGFLTYLYNTSSDGETPRFMCFSPDYKQLIVANEDSDKIVFFDIDLKSGLLKQNNELSIKTENPVCIVFKKDNFL